MEAFEGPAPRLAHSKHSVPGEAPKRARIAAKGAGSSTAMLFNRPSTGWGRRAGLSHGGLSTSRESWGQGWGSRPAESWWGSMDPVNVRHPRRAAGEGPRRAGGGPTTMLCHAPSSPRAQSEDRGANERPEPPLPALLPEPAAIPGFSFPSSFCRFESWR